MEIMQPLVAMVAEKNDYVFWNTRKSIVSSEYCILEIFGMDALNNFLKKALVHEKYLLKCFSIFMWLISGKLYQCPFFIGRIRSISNVPIIAILETSTREQEKALRVAGASACLMFPYDTKEVAGVIEKCFNHFKQENKSSLS